MTLDLVDELKIEFEESDQLLGGFGDSRVLAVGVLGAIITIDEVEIEMAILVLPNSVQNVGLMIKSSALDQPNIF